jgi:3-deoxy-D-manno-octulosonic-acid transferase
MYFFYALLTNLAVISPLIFIYRILKGKEDPKGLRENLYIFSKKN